MLIARRKIPFEREWPACLCPRKRWFRQSSVRLSLQKLHLLPTAARFNDSPWRAALLISRLLLYHLLTPSQTGWILLSLVWVAKCFLSAAVHLPFPQGSEPSHPVCWGHVFRVPGTVFSPDSYSHAANLRTLHLHPPPIAFLFSAEWHNKNFPFLFCLSSFFMFFQIFSQLETMSVAGSRRMRRDARAVTTFYLSQLTVPL